MTLSVIFNIPYHFVHTILSMPFCPIPFYPYTILSIPFCPYHFVRCHFVLEPSGGVLQESNSAVQHIRPVYASILSYTNPPIMRSLLSKIRHQFLSKRRSNRMRKRRRR